MPDIADIYAQAWEAVKTPGQPKFNELSADYRGELIAEAESPSRVDESENEFDRPACRFAAKVQELSAHVPAEVAEELVAESPISEFFAPHHVESDALAIEPVDDSPEMELEADTLEIPPVEEVAEEDELKGTLPEGFPARAALIEAGLNTYHRVRKQRDSEEGLTGVPGIGEPTAAKIVEALGE